MGDGGGSGLDKSTTGGSFLIFAVTLPALASPRPLLRRCALGFVGDSQSTSRGGVKRSRGGSYGVALAERALAERESGWGRRCEGEGAIQSAWGLAWCGERSKPRLVGDKD